MSGRKNVLTAFKLLSAQSLAANFSSPVTTLTTATHVGYNVAASGVTDNTGTFSVEHRLWKNQNEYSEWATLTLSPTPTLGDADTVMLIDVTVPPGQIRLSFTAAGGTPDGVIDVWLSGEQT